MKWPALSTPIFAGFVFLLAGCSPLCSNTIVSRVQSPDGKYEATAFIRDCGATTDFSPQVYIGLKGEKIGETGNIFIGNHSDKIRIQWSSPIQLEIFSECDVMMIVTNYHGTTITFTKSK